MTGNHVSDNGGNGGIFIRGSKNITVQANEVLGNDGGIISLDTTRTSIENNTIVSNADNGVVVDMSAIFPIEFSIVNNTISSHGASGITVFDAEAVSIGGNAVSGNFVGISLGSSATQVFIQNNTIESSGSWAVSAAGSKFLTIAFNRMLNNGGSVYLLASLNASVHHNDFVDNPAGPYDSWSNQENRWDDGYPSGGNHWSAYAGTDNCSGENQNICPDPDGIGDLPYFLDADSADRYPLMAPLFDDVPPAVAISYPSEGQLLEESPVLVTGTAFDVGSLDRVEVRVNGEPWQIATGTVSWAQAVSLVVGANRIEARAWDDAGNSSPLASANVTYSPNTPPIADFTVTPPSGEVSTLFEVDASSSSDAQDNASVLEVRWDWEGDGVWDTGWSPDRTAEHQYSLPGVYTVRVEVRDSGELTNSTTVNLTVVPSSKPLADWSIPVLTAIVIALIAVAILWEWRRKVREPPEMEE